MATDQTAQFRASVTAAMDSHHNPHDRLKAGAAQLLANARAGVDLAPQTDVASFKADVTAILDEFGVEIDQFVEAVFKGHGK